MLNHPNIDPVAFSVGPISVHWYGIMYLMAFACAWWLCLQRSKRSDSPLLSKHVEDLIVYCALGVVIGGRIGYVVFYNLGAWMQDPLWVFKVWEGGMSFHGGLLGVIFATLFYCRKIGISFYDLMDFVAVAVPPGLGFGRLGNFIGQELWGRETDASWGMVFPNDPDQLVRHPSQLYQAFLEGLVLFLILYFFAKKSRPRLAISGLFLMCYGIFRFAVEFVREPDAHLQDLLFDWMTRGQQLSLPMIIGGLGIIIYAYTKGFGEPVAFRERPQKADKNQKNIADKKAKEKAAVKTKPKKEANTKPKPKKKAASSKKKTKPTDKTTETKKSKS